MSSENVLATCVRCMKIVRFLLLAHFKIYSPEPALSGF